MHLLFKSNYIKIFNVDRKDIGGNGASVMVKEKSPEFCDKYGIIPSIRSANYWKVKGIGVTQEECGIANVKMALDGMKLLIHF